MSDEIAEYCGFNSNWDMLTSHWNNEQLMDLLQEYVCDDSSGWIHEIIEELAKEHYDWVDHDQIRADYEDAKYQEWKDQRRGID